MNKLIGIALLASTAISTAAYAEESDSIIVTARKTEENLKDVPVSVRVVDAEELRAKNAVTTDDIPGFSSRPAITNTETIQMALHGQAQNAADLATDGAVGVYVDGVYYARTYGMNSTLLDVKNVQVLYGPQGTLFGRNSTGGAVLIKTNDPNLGSYEGNAEVTYGRFNQLQTTGVLNLPVGETFSVRIAGTRNTRDGYVKNSVTGKDLNPRDAYNVRGKVLFQPLDNIKSILSVEYYESNSTEAKQLLLGFGSIANLGSTTPLKSYATSFQPASNINYTSVSSVTEIGKFKLTGGWRRTKDKQSIDYDAILSPIGAVFTNVNIEQLSAEAQYNGEIGGLKYIAGAFYFKENGFDNMTTDFFNHSVNVGWNYAGTNQSYGAFGNASYDFGPLTANAGIRYTHDKKEAVTNNYMLNSSLSPTSCVYRTAVLSNSCSVKYEKTFNKVSWTAGLDYRLDSNNMVFAKVSTGYRSGGINPRGFDTATAAPFYPETIIEYQVGVKGELSGVTYSLAGFYNRSNDIQQSTVFYTTIPTNIIRNAAKSRSYGGEATISAQVTPALKVTLNGILVDPKYITFIDARTGADTSDSLFYMTTKKQFTADVKYDVTDRLSVSTNFVWSEKTPQSSQSLAYLSGIYGATNGKKIFDLQHTDTNRMLNLRANYRVNDNVDFSIWGRNVLNERVLRSASNITNQFVVGTFNDPVTYGATIRARF